MESHEQPEPIPGIDRPLTPQECKRLAESFGDLPPKFQLTAEDLEILQEEQHGAAQHYGTPLEAMAAMERRLAILKKQKSLALDVLGDCAQDVRRTLMGSLADLNCQIAAAQERLDHYRFQQRHEN
jgi:hypothetical protein